MRRIESHQGRKKKFDIKEVKLDLGGLGHERRKPTTLGTNIKALGLLDGLSAANVEGKNVMNIPLEQKVKESWSTRWCRRCRAMIGPGMPFNRECPECQKGAGRSRPCIQAHSCTGHV